MKYFFAISCCAILVIQGNTQPPSYSFRQLGQLDSLGKSSSISRYFGELYFHFLQLVEKKLEKADTSTQRLVRNFEAVFAQLYIDAAVAWQNHKPISLPAWRAYFADTGLQPIQYKLLGANAHLNGGLAAAIAGSYTPGEWRILKKKYSLFNECLNKTYRLVFREALNTIPRARVLDMLSMGIDKTAGQYYLYKWRKRQMRLAKYWFAGSTKYQKLSAKINRKKEKIDRLVVTGLYR
jgi:Family of unknown function (DUF5995)